jgi:hypothetical protein
VRRLAPLAVIALALAGCHWSQGWHWPRLGTYTKQTVIYVQDDVVSYQDYYLAWAASYYDGHPELIIRVVNTCPVGRNCVVARTQEISPYAGLTSVGCCSAGNHIGASVLRLDPDVGRVGTVSGSKQVVFHEFCHALGGGFSSSEAIHGLCSWAYRGHTWEEISRVYHDDPG